MEGQMAVLCLGLAGGRYVSHRSDEIFGSLQPCHPLACEDVTNASSPVGPPLFVFTFLPGLKHTLVSRRKDSDLLRREKLKIRAVEQWLASMSESRAGTLCQQYYLGW